MGNLCKRLFGILLGLCFAGGGAVLLVNTLVPVFRTWDRARTWQPAWAQVESVDGADNETRARYRYTFDGIEYFGKRVYLAEFKDNIGGYHEKLQARLKAQQHTETPVAVWVNPENPLEAIIDREIRWGLVLLTFAFCAIFMAVGGFVCLASLSARAGRKIREPSTAELRREWERQKNGHPDSTEGFIKFRRHRLHELHKEAEESTDQHGGGQWRQRKEWASARIRSEKESVNMWIFAVLWCGISSPMLFYLPGEVRAGNYLALIGLIFPAVGIYLLARAIVMSFELHRFGTIEYSMDPYPGSIGGNVGGSILIRRFRETNVDFLIKLECVFSYQSGSGEDKTRREDIRWAEEGIAGTARLADGVRLDFRFDVPPELPESDIHLTGDHHFWRLKVTADLPGVDLDRTFIIPVFKTAEQSRHARPDLSRQAEEARQKAVELSRQAIARADFAAAGLTRSVRIRRRGRGLLLVYPMFRNKMLTLILLFVGGCFGGFAIPMLSGFGSHGFLAVFAFIVGVPFALIGFIAIGSALYISLNTLRVTIAQGRVTVLRLLAGLPVFYKLLPGSEIRELTVDRSGSTGQGTGKVEHFRIVAHTKTGGTVTLGEGIDGSDLAGQFRDFLWQKIRGGS